MFKNALVSVANKDGLVDFIKPLAQKGMRVVSTGGTAQLLKENGIEVVKVSEQTGFAEVMDGRVKTLHPRVHMALLAREYVKQDMETLANNDLQEFDLVIGNLYAFEQALKQDLADRDLQEFIDIGGPSFLRAAAKSFSRITTVCDPSDYNKILANQEISLEMRKELAAKVFYHVSAYDSMVARALSSIDHQEEVNESKKYYSLGGELVQTLRYGENPQQQANWYRVFGERGLQDAEILQGKALSFNNLLDLDAALTTLLQFQEPTCVAVKHNNPCGVGSAKNLSEAVVKGLSADPVSVFGGIVAINGIVNDEMALELSKIFLECIVANDFTPEATRILATKKNLRLLKAGDMSQWRRALDFRRILGGFLVQDQDRLEHQFHSEWQVIGEKPNEKIQQEMIFAMKVCASLKSNAIAVTANQQSLGLGMGQVNRVDAVQQAIARVKQFHPKANTQVLASDAFFPFADSIEKAAAAGIQWIIQPGGSIRDEEVIAAVEKHNMGMVFTGVRHFKH